MNPVTADVYGGKENGNIVIDTRHAQTVYSVNLKTDKVDANKLLSSVSSLKQTLDGMLRPMNGTFSSTSADALARSLNGDMEPNRTNGKLMNLDLLHELAVVGQFVGALPAKRKNFTNLVQAFRQLQRERRRGLVNLADQSISLHVTAVLNKALSQQAFGGLMNTALAKGQNDLVLPVVLTGTFQHPQVARPTTDNADEIAELLPTTNNPTEFTGSLLGAMAGSKTKSL